MIKQQNPSPPWLVRWLLDQLLPATQRDALLGDLEEEYVSKQEHGDWWYCGEAIAALAYATTHAIRSTIRGTEQQGRSTMIQRYSARTIATAVTMNVLAFVVFWLTAFGLIRFAERVLHGWPSSELMQTAALAVGVLVALRMRARVAALLMAGFLAFSLAELALHSIYGIRAVQGAPTHFAVMTAGAIGVALGVFLVPYVTRSTPPEIGTCADDTKPLVGEAANAIIAT
jgi:hypothetical protein